ncbi:MAG: helical backbone metal receptor [Gammaproteobacteria bacterium]
MGNTLIDAAGTAHRVAEGQVRIVSLVPSITECLCDLGLTDSLVGRTGFCVHPRARVLGIEKVGGTKDVDIEKIRALKPTHVVLNIDENLREVADKLAVFVPGVVVTHPLSPHDNLDLYALLGGIFNRDAQAAELGRALRAEFAALEALPDLPARRVLYLIWRKPWMTISRDTYISRMLALVNWQTFPATATRRYPELQLGEARGQADLALLSSEPYPFRKQHLSIVGGELGPNTGVHLVEGDMLSWYGSRAIPGIRYLRELAQRLNGAASGD